MLFKILSISHGWFEVDFNRQFILTNSNFMRCDAPALLLEALCNLIENKSTEEWLCWQDEPGAYILRLGVDDNQLILEIYDTDKDSMDLDYRGKALSQYIVKRLYHTQDSIIEASKNILLEFELYENGNGRQRYIHHWDEFPQQNYSRLKKLLHAK